MAKAASKTERKIVLLTGITGFIAKQILVDLLAAGYKVRGTMRNLAKQGEIDAVVEAAGFPRQDVEYIEADLLTDANWAEAAMGCDYVIHTASPFPLNRPKARDALVAPAVGGTMRVLEAAHQAGIKRIVLTSSVVSISEGTPYVENYEFSEADWSDAGSQTIDPYPLSKTLAERAAWDFIGKHKDMELAVINPSFVMGPVQDGDLNTSAELVKMFINGKYPGVPDLQFGIVDVRDISAAHIQAMISHDAAGKRFICSSGNMTMMDIANTLRASLASEHTKKLPKFVMPKLLLRLVGLIDPAVKSILGNVGKRSRFNNGQAQNILNIDFIKSEDSVVAMAQSLIDKKLI